MIGDSPAAATRTDRRKGAWTHDLVRKEKSRCRDDDPLSTAARAGRGQQGSAGAGVVPAAAPEDTRRHRSRVWAPGRARRSRARLVAFLARKEETMELQHDLELKEYSKEKENLTENDMEVSVLEDSKVDLDTENIFEEAELERIIIECVLGLHTRPGGEEV